MIAPVGAALVVFVLVTAVATILLRDVLAATVVFAGYGLGMALLYAVLLAPDVAMTEAAVGAGVTTVLLLLTLARTARAGPDRLVERVNVPALVATGALFVVLIATVAELPEIGSADAPVWANPVTQYYLDSGYADTGVRNAVTAVLAGYRGFDTFGEVIVVFVAGVATLVVLDRTVFTGD